MTAQQFIEEVKGSTFDAEDFTRKYAEFQEYQQLALQTLDAFRQVCDKNDIPYQLAWGSLLGAIRDGGQIPWDYDVDVFVPYYEKNNLVEALKRDLDDEFYFYCPEIDPKCRHFCMRIAPKGYYSDVLHVDVFYLVGAPEDPEKCAAFAKRIVELTQLRYQKLVNPIRACMGRFKGFVKCCLMRLKTILVPLSRIEREFEELCTKYNFDTATYYVSADIFATDALFPADLVRQTILHTTEHGTYRIPVGYEEVLHLLYKDYTRIFPLESRMREMNEHYSVLKKYGKK